MELKPLAMSSSKPTKVRATQELFPIRTVSSLTGVNVITLRAWEQRHGLIRPARTPKGHRLYRREDIDRINRAVTLLEKGIAISQVRNSLDQESPGARSEPHSPLAQYWALYQSRMLGAIARFDEDGLEDAYGQALSVHPIEEVTQQLMMPLLQELGFRWERGEGAVAEEHFFGVFLRNKLGARFHHRARGATGVRVLAACLPGEQHEIGLLLFALAAQERGLRPVLLGANMPLEELSASIKRARCRGIVLSASISPAPQVLRERLPRLVASSGIPVFVGGMASVRERDAIVSAGAIPLGNDLAAGAERIRATLAT